MWGVKHTAKSIGEQLIRGLRDGSIELGEREHRQERFVVVVEGMAPEKIDAVWDDLCKTPMKDTSPDLLAIYPKLRDRQGNQFRFVDGNPEQMSDQLACVLRDAARSSNVFTHVGEAG